MVLIAIYLCDSILRGEFLQQENQMFTNSLEIV